MEATESKCAHPLAPRHCFTPSLLSGISENAQCILHRGCQGPADISSPQQALFAQAWYCEPLGCQGDLLHPGTGCSAPSEAQEQRRLLCDSVSPCIKQRDGLEPGWCWVLLLSLVGPAGQSVTSEYSWLSVWKGKRR